MKAKSLGLISRLLVLNSTLLVIGASGFATAAPEQVDTELLLMIDVSGSIANSEFDLMMDSYGRAMTSQTILDAIQSGATGSIATSVMFWSGKSEQQVAVPWMKISDAVSATRFADAITSAMRPFAGKTAIATAMNQAVGLFGTETGRAENGFNSVSQIIDVAGDGVDNDSGARTMFRSIYVDASRDAALASGVDMINGLAINDSSVADRTDAIRAYYAAHVIGGGVGGTDAFVEYAADYSVFEGTLLTKLNKEISAGAKASVNAPIGTAVPEPATAMTAVLGLGLLLRRRR